MFGRVKLDDTLLTCNKGNFHQTTARRLHRTLVTVMRETRALPSTVGFLWVLQFPLIVTLDPWGVAFTEPLGRTGYLAYKFIQYK